MKNAKRIIAIVMAAFILCQGFAVVSAEDSTDEAPVWSFENSMLVTVRVDEARSFTPADFPEVDCIEVLVTEKIPFDGGYEYELMLVLDTTAEGYTWDSTAESLQTKPHIVSTDRNRYAPDYDEKGQVCILNETELNLRIGESAELFTEHVSLLCFWSDHELIGIIFEIDPDIIDEVTLLSESLKEHGINEYYTFESYHYSDTEPAGQISESHQYVYYSDDVNSCARLITRLSADLGIKTTSLLFEQVPTGEPYGEYWTVGNESIVNMGLSGGDNGGYDFTYTPIGQTATVTGLTLGTTTVTVERRGYGASASAVCIVTVYMAGDVNNDGGTDSLDAAYLLKYDAGLLDQTQLELAEGDVNGDGRVDSLDAALILKYDAGLE